MENPRPSRAAKRVVSPALSQERFTVLTCFSSLPFADSQPPNTSAHGCTVRMPGVHRSGHTAAPAARSMASACRGDTSTSLRTYVSLRSRLGRKVFSRLSFAPSGRSGWSGLRCSELRPRFFRAANCAPGLKVPERTVRPRNPTLISMAGTALGGRLGGSSIARTEVTAGFFSGLGECEQQRPTGREHQQRKGEPAISIFYGSLRVSHGRGRRFGRASYTTSLLS